MYIGPTDSHTALVVEQTFLLCKPDAEPYHRHIMQTLSDAGFQILAKSFIITPTLAEEIAGTFQSVRRRMHAERGTDKLFGGLNLTTQNKALSLKKYSKNASRGYFGDSSWGTRCNAYDPTKSNSSNALNGGADDDESDNDDGYSGKLLDSDCSQMDAHQGIMAEIIRLTRRHGCVQEGVNAGLLPNADGKDSAAIDTHNSSGGEGCMVQSEGDTQGDQKVGRRVLTAVVLKNTAIESLSYQDLLNEHVRHLAFGGTCLAVELSRQNAVERLLEIVGPENPTVARRVAPGSIRARFGKDLIQNAVHAACNLVEASYCISAVFGFTTQYSAADIRTNSPMAVADGIKDGDMAKSAPAVVRPYCDLVCVPHSAFPALGAAFHVEKANPQAHISYYTGEMTPGETAESSAEAPAKAGQENAVDSRSWQQKAEELEKRAEQERMDILTQAKLLRTRELDLLLREHAMRMATSGLCSPARPVKNRGGRHSPEDTLSPRTPTQKHSFNFMSVSRDMLLSQALPELLLPSTKRQSFAATTEVDTLSPPVISAEDISLLLSRPVRLRALYVALKQFSQNSMLLREDIIGLYNRSPAIQLLWVDNHNDFFKKYLEQHIEEPVSFDSFVLLLMFLFKQ